MTVLASGMADTQDNAKDTDIPARAEAMVASVAAAHEDAKARAAASYAAIEAAHDEAAKRSKESAAAIEAEAKKHA